jgi:hypothetical protein
MEIVIESAAGLDVHKKTVMVCVRKAALKGKGKQQLRQFGTTTRQIEAMAEWLAEQGVTHVAMEALVIVPATFPWIEMRLSW